MDDFGRVVVNLADLVVVESHCVDNLNDATTRLIELLQVGRLLTQFAPKFLVQLGRLHHGLLAERDVVVEADDLDEVVLLLLVLFKVVLDDLLEAVDDELLYERGRCPLSHHELFVGSGVLVQALHVEEGEGDVQLGATRKLLDALPVHPFDLYHKQLAVLVHL